MVWIISPVFGTDAFDLCGDLCGSIRDRLAE